MVCVFCMLSEERAPSSAFGPNQSGISNRKKFKYLIELKPWDIKVPKLKDVVGRDKLHEMFGTRNFEVQSESFAEFHLRLLSLQTNQSPSCAWELTSSKISFSVSSSFFSAEENFLHIDRHINCIYSPVQGRSC